MMVNFVSSFPVAFLICKTIYDALNRFNLTAFDFPDFSMLGNLCACNFGVFMLCLKDN